MEQLHLIAAYSVACIVFPFLGGKLTKKRMEACTVNLLRAFCLLYSFLFFFVPILQMSTQTFKYDPHYSDVTILLGLLCFLLFGFSVIFGFRVLNKENKYSVGNSFAISAWRLLDRKGFILGVIIMVVPGLVSAYILYRIILEVGFGEYMGNRIIVLSGLGLLFAPIGWIGLFGSILSADLMHTKFYKGKVPWKKAGVCFLFLALASLCGVLKGSRTQMLLPWSLLFACYMFFSFSREGFKYRLRHYAAIVLIIPAVFAAANVLGYLRTSAMSHSNASLDEIDESGTGDVDSFVVGLSKFGIAENVFWLLENSRVWDYQYGATFVSVVFGLVPRSIWPDKPLGGGPTLKNMISPGSYNLESGRNISSTTTGLPAETFMNFGVLGLPLVGLGYGFVLCRISKLFMRIRCTTHFVAFVYLSFYSLQFLWGEFFGAAAWTFISMLPFAILILALPERKISPEMLPVQGMYRYRG